MSQHDQEATPQRTATRAPVNRPVRMQFDDSMDVVEGQCVNLSIGGMHVHVADSRPQGSLVRFELPIDQEHSIRGLGEVVWMRVKGAGPGREPGIGIKFRFLEQRDRQQIFKLVSQYIKERLSQRSSKTASSFKETLEPNLEGGTGLGPPVAYSPESVLEPSSAIGSSPLAAEGVPVAEEKPAMEEAPAAEDLATAPYEQRRADSLLRGAEELSGPLDLVKEVEPWHSNVSAAETFGGEAAGTPEPSSADSSSGDEDPAEDLPYDDEYLESPRRQPPTFALAVLLLLALVAVLAYFWGDLFPDGGAGPEVPTAEKETPRDSAPAGATTGGSPVPDRTPSPTFTSPPPAAEAPPKSPPPPPATAAAFERLLNISWQPIPGGLEVIFTTDGSISQQRWRHFRLGGDTPREVVRILGVSKPFGRTQIQVNGPGLRQIRIGYHKKSRGNELHVVMDMSGPQARISEIHSVGSQLVVRVEAP